MGFLMLTWSKPPKAFHMISYNPVVSACWSFALNAMHQPHCPPRGMHPLLSKILVVTLVNPPHTDFCYPDPAPYQQLFGPYVPCAQFGESSQTLHSVANHSSHDATSAHRLLLS